MTRFLRPISLFCFLFVALSARSQLNVTTESNPLLLAQKILGKGVTVLNAQYKGVDIASGTFSAIQGSFPLRDGIVLTSGRAKTIGTANGLRGIEGPANYGAGDAFQSSNDNGAVGDPTLNQYSGKTTVDATVLEFDFIPQGDSINVRYIFGSEEYPTYTCSQFNDVFAFLITGPGFASPTNIALVPNTNVPVAINTINSGVAGSEGVIKNCTDFGSGSPFPQYHVTNQGGTFFTYNGRTVVLTAKAKVQPCQVYHIKLAIADAGDGALDSGVFIEAGSFSSDIAFKPVITGPLTNANNDIVLVEACKSAELKITRSEGTVGAFTVNVSFGGSATSGADYTAIPAQLDFSATDNEKIFPISAVADAFNEGTEKAVLYFSKTLACTQQVADSVVIYIQDSLVTKSKTDTTICSGSPIIIKSKDPVANVTNTYLWNTGSATQSILVSNAGTYYVAHTYSQRCVDIDTFAVKNMDPTFAVNNPAPFVCEGSPADITVNTNADSIRWSTGATANTITVSAPGQYWVLVKNKSGCIKTDTFDVGQRPSPILDLGKDTAICTGESIFLNATYPGATYVWNTGATSSSINTRTTGLYTVASTFNGCTSRDSINIGTKKSAIANAGPDLEVIQNKSVQLNAEVHPDNATYLWSPSFTLNNAFIPDPVATPATATEYTVKVTSVDGCVAQDKVWVSIQYPLDIPNAFSPNGDGINDRWRIANLGFYPNCRVYIFNRYGQEMFFSKGYREPWDGIFRGKALGPATYYYVIEPGDGRRFGGWVLLVR
jgi:gliding motility-associated-like protein